MIRVLVFISLVLLTTESHALAGFKLNGDNWRVKGGEDLDVPATVPGGIYSDLMDNNVIRDIFAGSGDTDYRWVGSQNWIYYTNFTVDEEVLGKQFVNLVFDGLDTFATVFINGVQVGTAQNMFVQYVYPVKDVLQVGSNTVEVVFQSSVIVAADLAANQAYPVPPDCPGPQQNGECHANQIRKMQASYSWDWGPAFPSIGIWKDVSIEAFDTAVIRYVTASTQYQDDDGGWLVTVDTYFDAGSNDRVEGQLSFSLPTDSGGILGNGYVEATANDNGEIVARTALTVNMSDVTLWWPNGYGVPRSDQPLYTLTVSFYGVAEESSKQIQIAYRTIELVQDVIDGDNGGATFYFRVNGVPIFAKGANEIPIDVLPERGQDEAKITELLESAAEANMNMLRVWGGGVYESDFFYAEADRLGIMIWQDMMFACALYPTAPDYLDNVKWEVDHQVLRLKHHPSIALFAGNNENEVALWQNWFQVSDNFTFYRDEYVKLFIDVVGAEIERLAPESIFLSSSPANGMANLGDEILKTDPQSGNFGDVHYYNYGDDSWDYRTFPVARFASEFGYQSMPRLDAWLGVTDDVADLNPDGDFVDHRQHHPDGRTQNNDLINLQLHLPENDATLDYAATFIYYSQIVQAMAYKTEVEHYRSYAQRVDPDGGGYTMGALYWQLNDVWIAPTWAGIDHTGRWKMVHYYAKNFYATNLVTAKLIDGQLKLYVVMDAPVEKAPKIRLHVVPYATYEPASTQDFDNFTVESYKATEAVTLDAAALLIDSGCGADFVEASANCFFHFHLLDPDDGHMIAPANWLFPAKLKNSNLSKPNVEITSVTQLDHDGLSFEVNISSDVPALFVWLDAHEISGRFADNGLVLVSPITTVGFKTKIATTVDELTSFLTVTHL